ncbi:MAG TPA: HAD-IA family hydrolase [Gemmatimonadales bacterium]|nr:HAD-IA family hydrolase [Gemmatimonadales bacterium]
MSITHIFFDIGGVLGTNGWDQGQRAAAVAAFHLDATEFDERHEDAVSVWDTGGMSLDDYLDCTVFFRPRPFGRDEFRTFMLSQSVAFPETIAVARRLAGLQRYRLMTLNNESAELNSYRVALFGLRNIFIAFFTSCWMGALKPSRRIYERALEIAQAQAASSLFIDDRERNLETARQFGMQTILYRNPAQLERDLAFLNEAT